MASEVQIQLHHLEGTHQYEVKVTSNGVVEKTVCSETTGNLILDPNSDKDAVRLMIDQIMSKINRCKSNQSSSSLSVSPSPLPSPSPSPPLPAASPETLTEECTGPFSSAIAIWGTNEEKLLVQVVQDFDSKKPVKNKWGNVSEKLATYGVRFTSEQCRLKYRHLKERYAKRKKKNNTSGESPASEDDIYELFDSQVDNNPTYLVDSGVQQSHVHVVESQVERNESGALPDTEREHRKAENSLEGERRCSKGKNKKRKRTVDTVTETLNSLFEDREKKAEKRHREKMDLMKSFIAALNGKSQTSVSSDGH